MPGPCERVSQGRAYGAVEFVAAIAHHLAGLTDIAELPGKLQQSNFGTNDFLFGGHGVLQCAEAWALRHPGRSAPRPGLRFAVGKQDTSVRLSFSLSLDEFSKARRALEKRP